MGRRYNKIGIIGLGCMGLPMARNLAQKADIPVLGFDIMPKPLEIFEMAGGVPVRDVTEIYKDCDVIMQVLPTHETVIHSVEEAIRYGDEGKIIIDFSSTAPDIIWELKEKTEQAGMKLLDAPISGGTPAAEAGTLAIMAGGDKEVFEAVRDILCMVGTPVYVGPCGSGSITKLVNNIIAGMNMLVIAEAYALGEKAGMDLPTIFEATRGGYAGGPVYENKVPKLIRRDYQPGARIAVHRKDIINAKKFAEKLDVSLPVTDVLLQIMDWMMENGYGNEDQIAMVKYYENSMKIKIGNE